MQPKYSKIWLIITGTVVGMTLTIHAAHPNGAIRRSAKADDVRRVVVAGDDEPGPIVQGSLVERSADTAGTAVWKAMPVPKTVDPCWIADGLQVRFRAF